LSSVAGVSEVASVGGYVKEYQIDINPEALKAYNIGIDQVMRAVQNSNRDIGAKTIEVNKVEYLVRGLGYIESIEDIENTLVVANDHTPVLIRDIGIVSLGPSERRGVLDKAGAEVVGGVIAARYGSNPMEVIANVKQKIEELKVGLPSKTLADGTVSKLTVVPFYDRSQLIEETLETLDTALTNEVLISIIVVVLLVLNLRASILISSLLPVAVLMTFIGMRYFGVDANVVALSGIAIAIGVMVDVGIIFVENTMRHLEMPENKGARKEKLLQVIYNATVEVGPAVTTALATTIVSFLPVFFMENAEGKLFRPLAFTKTFALVAAFVLGVIVLPMLSYWFFSFKVKRERMKLFWNIVLVVSGVVIAMWAGMWLPSALTVIGGLKLVEYWKPCVFGVHSKNIILLIILLVTLLFLAQQWVPLGHRNSLLSNYIFVIAISGLTLVALMAIVKYYEAILNWCLVNKGKFLLLPLFTILIGGLIWMGFPKVFGFIANGTDKLGWNIR